MHQYNYAAAGDMVKSFINFHYKVLLIKIFLVLDIDGDGIISREDMDGVLDLMTDNAMDDELKDRIINGVGRMCLLALML